MVLRMGEFQKIGEDCLVGVLDVGRIEGVVLRLDGKLEVVDAYCVVKLGDDRGLVSVR